MSDNKIIFFLLIALFLQIGVLLWHLEFFNFQQSNHSDNNGVLAGQIIQIENSTKRRPLNSLLWGKSEKLDNVFYHDSVLTLSQSTAKILLANNTQIDLSENTLITIEPPLKDKSNEIRIRFAQGSIQARNPYKNTFIKDKNLIIDIKKDSNIKIKKSGKDNIEVEVVSGVANVKYKNSNIELKEKKILELNQGTTSIETIDNNIRWVKKPLSRIYSHNSFVDIDLSWTHNPTQLIFQTKNKDKKTIPLDPNKKTKKLKLETGTHKLVLKNGDKRSESLTIEVWKAPIISLISPLPRDRRKQGDVSFLWTQSDKINSYQIRLQTPKGPRAFDTTDNKINLPMIEDLNLTWSVWGVDSMGFLIPPPYSNSLFIRENPFSAPKIKSKEKNKTKDTTSANTGFINYLLFTNAFAQTLPENETYLSWGNIPGANYYIIEISENKDFRNTLIQTKILKPEFLWKHFNPKKNTFWRVAAGDNSGRMGLFSEPIKVEHIKAPTLMPSAKTPIPVAQKIKPNKGISTKNKIISKKTDVTSKPPSIKVHTPPKNKALSQKKNTKNSAPFLTVFQLYWLPGVSSTKLKRDGALTANLTGTNLFHGLLSLKANITSEAQLGATVNFNKTTYQPIPKASFPFQSDLEISRISTQLYYQNNESNWSYGLSVRSDVLMLKSAPEAVALQKELSYGPLVQYNTPLWVAHYSGNLSVEFGKTMNGIQSAHSFNLPVFWNFIGGVNFEFGQFSGKGFSRNHLKTSISLGLSF